MRTIALSLVGVLALTAGAIAKDKKKAKSKSVDLKAAAEELVVLEDGKLTDFESEIAPEFYVVYHSASW